VDSGTGTVGNEKMTRGVGPGSSVPLKRRFLIRLLMREPFSKVGAKGGREEKKKARHARDRELWEEYRHEGGYCVGGRVLVRGFCAGE